MAEVLQAIQRVTGQALPALVGARRPGDAAILVADTSLAREALGFKPSRSDLDSIIGDAWRWTQRAYPKV